MTVVESSDQPASSGSALAPGPDGAPPTSGSRPAAEDGAFLYPKRAPDDLVIPESRSYRVKRRVLGKAIPTDHLVHERLGKPTALAVFASDNLSSSAYATEEILRVLIPVIGLAAFSLVLPVTLAILGVLGLLILSYRQTIKAYPSAGGAYVVTRDNFGLLPAQVAGVALLTDYILTVSVSVAAGAAALASAFPVFEPYTLPLAIFFVLIIAGGNLKGVKESGKAFAVPTYFFIANMFLLLGVGLYKFVTGALIQHSVDVEGAVPIGGANAGLFAGASLWLVLQSFSSGGAAVTGVEAISNGVPAFREPAWKNARETLVIMGTLLGVMFFGLSALATQVHPVPYESGTPTVISQIGEAVYGDSPVGTILYFALQAGTMLILVMAANTSFADFPRLASFHADDDFMPRQLTKRGHRLVFSNGIISLAVAAIVLLVVTGAKVEHLIPLYAIGVFLSFTLSQGGMAKHHITLKEPGWRSGLVINGLGSIVSGIVCIVIAATKFLHGAWVIILLVPILVFLLFRLNKQYLHEAEVLERDAPLAATAPVRNRHVVLVLIDRLDLAAARAIQHARSLAPDAVTAVHVDLDPLITEPLVASWQRLGFQRIPLDVVACPDRRIERAAAQVAARLLADNDTEVTVLLPRREHTRFWHRFVHDHTAETIASALSILPHCAVTIVPFHFADPDAALLAGPRPTPETYGDAAVAAAKANGKGKGRAKVKGNGDDVELLDRPPGTVAIGDLVYRQQTSVHGRVHTMRVQPLAGAATLELTITDGTGSLKVVFFGRRSLAGVKAGTILTVTGRVGEHQHAMAMLNPEYEILVPAHEVERPPAHH